MLLWFWIRFTVKYLFGPSGKVGRPLEFLMLKLIDTSTAFYGAGLALQRKLFKIKTGAYSGRMAAVIPIGASTIALTYSDPPYLSWSEPHNVITDSADYPVGCWMDEGNNIHIAYTVSGSLNLAHKKLTFWNGNWNTGSVNIIYNGDANYYPSLYADLVNRLWVSWTRYSGGSYYINVKSSVDDGAIWGAGPGSSGTILTAGANSAYSRLEYLPTYLFCFYTEAGMRLAYRRYEIGGAIWYSETELFTGTDLGYNFSTAVSNDLKIGLALVSDSELIFKDFDGSVWSGNQHLDSDVAVAPAVKYNGSIPFVFYGKHIGSGQDQLYYSHRKGSGFSGPSRVTGELATFDTVLCYHPDAAVKFHDRTVAASDGSGGDVFHPESGKLLENNNEAIFLGQSERFYHVYATLSVNGIGGNVGWYYWNGSDWLNFVPSSGGYNFDASPALIRLWDDFADMPSDWQSSVINGTSQFWVKAVVMSSFGTAPIGSQLTAANNLPYITSL
jgi:hypothetical protein